MCTRGGAGDFAGLLAFMDETHFFALGIEGTGERSQIVMRLRDAERPEERGALMATAPLMPGGAVDLRIELSGGTASFDWRKAGAERWTGLAENVDVEGLASVHAGLFTGLVIGPYAVAGE